jgi:hypothetical protein
MPKFIYSPWAKFCGKGQDATAKRVCFTGKDARTEAGQPVVAAGGMRGEHSHPVNIACGPTNVHPQVAAIGPTQLRKPLRERGQECL